MKATGTWTKRNQQAVAKAYAAYAEAERTGTRADKRTTKLEWMAAVSRANLEAK